MKKREFAKLINKSSQLVSMFCRGQRRLTWITAKKCAEVAGNDPAWWMEASGKEIKKAINDKTD